MGENKAEMEVEMDADRTHFLKELELAEQACQKYTETEDESAIRQKIDELSKEVAACSELTERQENEGQSEAQDLKNSLSELEDFQHAVATSKSDIAGVCAELEEQEKEIARLEN